MVQRAEQTSRLSISGPRVTRGFNDLPGELRNQIYELLPATSLRHALIIGASCRLAREEYLPIYFQQNTIPLPFCRVQSFLHTFFANAAAGAICKIRVFIAADEPESDPIIDMQWIFRFLLNHPGVKLIFDGAGRWIYEALQLQHLVQIVMSTPAWRTHLASLDSLRLFTMTAWRRGKTYCTPRTPCELKFVLKPEYVGAWWDDERTRYQETEKLLRDLGMLHNPARGSLRLGSLNVRIFKGRDEDADDDDYESRPSGRHGRKWCN